MFKKIFPLLVLAILWATTPVLADNVRRPGTPDSPAAVQPPEAQGLCYSAPGGRGKVIKWAQSKDQCQIYQGQSWGQGGSYEDIRRAAPAAQAPPAVQPPEPLPGARYQCYSGPGGQGRVIREGTSLELCRANQGQSWGYSAHYENILPAPQPPDNPIYQQPGALPLCYFGLNGQGKVIKWAKTKEQCRTQTNAQSWGHSGHYENFYRNTRDQWR